MPDLMFHIIGTLSAIFGMGSLALSLNSHWHQIFSEHSGYPPAITLRIVGISCLLLSAICCFMADRPSMAVLVWIMMLTLSAVTIAMILARYPNK